MKKCRPVHWQRRPPLRATSMYKSSRASVRPTVSTERYVWALINLYTYNAIANKHFVHNIHETNAEYNIGQL